MDFKCDELISEKPDADSRALTLALLVGRHYVPPVNLKLASYENTQRGFNMKKDIQTIESKIVYENKWMSVREDKILRTNGHEGIYGVVEKNDFAVIAAIQDQQIYMVQQYRYPVEARFWELPQARIQIISATVMDWRRGEASC